MPLATKLIDALTGASTVTVQINRDTTFVAGGLGAAETIPVNVWDGNNWVAYYSDGAAVGLSSGHNQIVIVGAGDYQFAKGATSAAVTLSRIS